jgi:hypothetical protein
MITSLSFTFLATAMRVGAYRVVCWRVPCGRHFAFEYRAVSEGFDAPQCGREVCVVIGCPTGMIVRRPSCAIIVAMLLIWNL